MKNIVKNIVKRMSAMVKMQDKLVRNSKIMFNQSKKIKQLEAENKTLRESAINECIAIAKEAFNHQWPIRSCVDKFIALKALNQ